MGLFDWNINSKPFVNGEDILDQVLELGTVGLSVDKRLLGYILHEDDDDERANLAYGAINASFSSTESFFENLERADIGKTLDVYVGRDNYDRNVSGKKEIIRIDDFRPLIPAVLRDRLNEPVHLTAMLTRTRQGGDRMSDYRVTAVTLAVDYTDKPLTVDLKFAEESIRIEAKAGEYHLSFKLSD